MISKIFYNSLLPTILFLGFSLYAQEPNESVYFKYIDSASNKIDNFPNLANTFLDSIPTPLTKNIKGRISEYYHLKSVASSHLNHLAEIYHYNTLCLQYAEKEKNYEMAGAASLELFYNLYIVQKDSVAFEYLNKAKNYYTIDNDENGLIDVKQMRAYAEFCHENHEKSNALILSNLTECKSVKGDSFYYMYALFMLTSNYIHLNDDVNYKKYYTEFKKLENDTTISTLLFKIHDVTLNIRITDFFLERKKLDSTFHYLKKVDEMRLYMNNSDKENHFKNYITYFKELENNQGKNSYIDSLKYLQESLIKENIEASFKINESYIEISETLEEETQKVFLNRGWIVFLTVLLIGIIIFMLIRHKGIRKKNKEFTNRTKDYSFLKNNHEKLKAKVIGLEKYIVDLKKDVKNISSITNIEDQKVKIKELHKEIHHSSSVLLVKGEDHLDLINDLNVDFFNKITSNHPELNTSEIIICYYLFMGFKNKEIAVFINNSVRSVESKRYRIANKLDLKKKKYKLVDYLKEHFKQTVSTLA